MRKYLFAVLAALSAGVSLAFTPVAHTNSYVRDGVTYVQRGGLGTADYVVTNVTMPTITYPVTSVNGKTGEVSLVATDVGAVASQVTSGDVGVRLVQTANSLTLNKIDKEGDEWVLSPNKKLTLRPKLLVVEGDCAVGIDTESAVLGFSDSTASFIDNDYDGYIGQDVWMTGGHEIYHPYSPYGTQNQKIALKGDLSSYVPTGRKVNEKSLAQDITLNASDVTALPDNSASLIANNNFKTAVEAVSPPVELPSKWALANVTNATGGAVTAADVGARASDWMPTAAQVGALPDSTTHLSGDVPTSRTVNNKALSQDITLNAADVGARADSWMPTAAQVGALPDSTTHLSGDVPTTRTVNNKALSADITLTATDVNARPSSWTPSATDVGAIAKSGITDGTFPIRIRDNTPESSASLQLTSTELKYTDDEGAYISFSPNGFDYRPSGSAKINRYWSGLAFEEDYDSIPTVNSERAVTSGGIYNWVSGNYLTESLASQTYLSKTDASTTYLTKTNAEAIYLTQNAAGNYRTKTDLNVYVENWNIEELVNQFCPAQAGKWKYRVSVMPYAPICLYIEFASKSSSSYNPIALSQNTYPSVADANSETAFVIGDVMESIFSGLQSKTAVKGGTSGTLATSTDLQGYVPTTRTINSKALSANITLTASDISDAVPNTRKINGQALTQDITIEGMTDNAVVWTNSTLKTKAGATVNAMDYQAMTNTVNAVKAEFYDEPLQVNWTVRMVNGEMKLYATTNVNMSTL